MLAALLLLGLLPLAAMPMLTEPADDSDSDDSDSDDGANPPPQPAQSPETGNMIDPATVAATSLLNDATSTNASGSMTVPPLPGTTIFSDFTRGSDMVQLDLSMMADPVTAELSNDAEGANISFLIDPEDPTVMTFEGLASPPTEDVILTLMDPASGIPYEVSLADAINTSDVLVITDPVDPEWQGETPPPGDPGTPIDPTDPTAPSDPSTEPMTPLIDPVDPNAEDLGPGGDLDLRNLMDRDSSNTVGYAETLATAEATGLTQTDLTDGDDALELPGNGAETTSLSMSQTAPVVLSDAPIDVIDGAAGDDSISMGSAGGFAFGGDGDDTLQAGAGAAALYGGGGADSLTATATAAYLDGGSGDDTVTGGAGDDRLEGGEHDDSTQLGSDVLDGGQGDDSLRGGYGADLLMGGAGNDVIDHQGISEERQIITHHEFAWHAGDDSDTLDGGDGDDLLIFDKHDNVTGGDGQDVFWLYYDGASAATAAQVTDFVPGEDFLRVTLNPQIGENGLPDILVEPSSDGANGHVFVNGDLVAVLYGAPTATASDVYAEVVPDVFP